MAHAMAAGGRCDAYPPERVCLSRPRQTVSDSRKLASWRAESESAWWLDAHTRRLLEDALDLGPMLTFTVGPGPPVTLPRQQVS